MGLLAWFRREVPAPVEPARSVSSLFSTHAFDALAPRVDLAAILNGIVAGQHQVMQGVAMDDASTGTVSFKTYGGGNTVSDALVSWYTSQGFIGHQLAGIIAQHWLINKACSIPAEDAVRKGYNAVSVDGDKLDPKQIALLKQYDRKYQVKRHMHDFIRKGRIFGVRVLMFKVESTDPQYYEKPFNLDGITPKSYKGIVQFDPYWISPMLDQAASSQPDSLNFYEPTFWMINGRKVHRSHLVIFRHAEPIDLLKPTYLYGGIPLPQMIMERVYAAERTANEAPQLAMTKRTSVWLTDIERVMADASSTIATLQNWSYYRDNYGIKLGDKEGDEFQQFDTSLADFDALIMTQYQLVAAQSNVPATKLLGTSPKGFNATGEYEESSYHELLESIQENHLTPMLERHHGLVLKAFGAGEIETSVMWNPLDSPTAKELAETNLAKAQTGAQLVASGAISSEDERARIALDKDSGYHELGLAEMPVEEDPLNDTEQD